MCGPRFLVYVAGCPRGWSRDPARHTAHSYSNSSRNDKTPTALRVRVGHEREQRRYPSGGESYVPRQRGDCARENTRCAWADRGWIHLENTLERISTQRMRGGDKKTISWGRRQNVCVLGRIDRRWTVGVGGGVRAAGTRQPVRPSRR